MTYVSEFGLLGPQYVKFVTFDYLWSGCIPYNEAARTKLQLFEFKHYCHGTVLATWVNNCAI